MSDSLCLRWLVGIKALSRFSASASYGISPSMRYAQRGRRVTTKLLQ